MLGSCGVDLKAGLKAHRGRKWGEPAVEVGGRVEAGRKEWSKERIESVLGARSCGRCHHDASGQNERQAEQRRRERSAKNRLRSGDSSPRIMELEVC